MQLGSVVYQVKEAFREITAIGSSKHSAKEAFRAQYRGSEQIDKFMAAFGKESKIYSTGTLKDYRAISIDFARFALEKFGIKDISKLTSEQAKTFLESKVNAGLAKDTIQKYSSALEKFESALTLKYGREYNFGIKFALPPATKENLKVAERSGYHPYKNPAAIVANIEAKHGIPESHKLAVKIVYETGFRLHKAITVAGIKIAQNDFSQKLGKNSIEVRQGDFYTQSKGGRIKVLSLSDNLKAELKAYLSDRTNFKLSSQEYKQILSELKAAANATGQKYEASYGFRHSSFLEKAADLQKSGLNFKEAWNEVSQDDHNRFVPNYTRG